MVQSDSAVILVKFETFDGWNHDTSNETIKCYIMTFTYTTRHLNVPGLILFFHLPLKNKNLKDRQSMIVNLSKYIDDKSPLCNINTIKSGKTRRIHKALFRPKGNIAQKFCFPNLIP